MLVSLPVETIEVTPRLQLLNLGRILGWVELCHIYVRARVQLLLSFVLDPIDLLSKVRNPPDVVRVAPRLTCQEFFDRKSHHKTICATIETRIFCQAGRDSFYGRVFLLKKMLKLE